MSFPEENERVWLPSEPRPGAGFGIRVAARLIDSFLGFLVGLVSGGVTGVVLCLLQSSGSISAGWQHKVGGLSALGILGGLVASMAYHALAEGLGGTSVGKLCCGLRVVRGDGARCSVKAGLIRSVAYVIDSLFFGAVGYQSMSASNRRQRYGDLWAGTMVVRADDVPTASRRSILLVLLGLGLGFCSEACILGSTVLLQAIR